ncbi:hypothetical protein [Paenarthrobacter nicotinovorans]|uniref:hypothetical protein n=1 Tax=Paenarthrobacter nicotinovorans TaxID=29320 RepID=UPI00047E300B|nr:hypothetical protein [Paenarthrobacter nicotinovorans]
MVAITKSDQHKRLRLEAIKRWSQDGVLLERRLTDLEKEFIKTVKEYEGLFFKPIELASDDDFTFHREVSYMIDAFDQLPARPDVAFDSTFKALESTIKRVAPTNDFSMSLRAVVANRPELALTCETLLSNIPMQTCEFLYKRLLPNLTVWHDQPRESKKNQVLSRLREAKNSSIDGMLDALAARSKDAEAGVHRKQAALLRKAFVGREITGQLHAGFQLDLPARVHVMLSAVLYTARNDRFHGESFSPFVSSKATLKTYVHPHFITIAAYSCLMAIWSEESSRSNLLLGESISDNLSLNLANAKAIFGANWNG